MKRYILLQGLLIQSLLISASEFEILENILPSEIDESFSVGLSHSRFDNSFDILNYSNKLNSTKPKKGFSDLSVPITFALKAPNFPSDTTFSTL